VRCDLEYWILCKTELDNSSSFTQCIKRIENKQTMFFWEVIYFPFLFLAFSAVIYKNSWKKKSFLVRNLWYFAYQGPRWIQLCETLKLWRPAQYFYFLILDWRWTIHFRHWKPISNLLWIMSILVFQVLKPFFELTVPISSTFSAKKRARKAKSSFSLKRIQVQWVKWFSWSLWKLKPIDERKFHDNLVSRN